MAIEVLRCPNCGAPLPAESVGGVVTCTYCKVAVTGLPVAAWGAGASLDAPSTDPRDAGLARAFVGEHRYAIVGRLAQGEGCDVFLARRDAQLSETVVIKVLRSLAYADRLVHEWKVLGDLEESTAQGAEHFARLVPQRVAHGQLVREGGDHRLASVFRWRSGFVHTLHDVMRTYPKGVDPRAAVWMWRRALELLGWVHRSGYVHGALLPEHLLVHARDHGVTFVGWSHAMRQASPVEDLVMLARCMVTVLGGDAKKSQLPRSVPAAIAELLVSYAKGAGTDSDAWGVKEQVGRVARTVYGPPSFEAFTMPGWKSPPGR